MRLLTPQKLEPGRFASRPDVAPEVKTQAFVHNDRLYVPHDIAERLNAARTECVNCLADMSAVWFTHKLTPEAVAARFVPSVAAAAGELPSWASSEYPYCAAFVSGLPYEGQSGEVVCTLVLSSVTITSKLFNMNWAALNVQTMEKISIDAIDIEEPEPEPQVVAVPSEDTHFVEIPSVITVPSDGAEVEQVDPDSLLAGGESHATRVIRLKRVEAPKPSTETEDDDVRRVAKKRVRRAKMKAMLARMSAQREEEDFRERYPVGDNESSFGYSDSEYERDDDDYTQSDDETADSNGDGNRSDDAEQIPLGRLAPSTVVVRKL